jgi:choline dehydrogenase
MRRATFRTLPANVAAGLKAQYAITNNWLSKDVGQLEIILTMLSGTSGAGIQAALQHPYSRGTILINSTNAFDYPAIDPGYFGMGYDIDILNKGVEFARKLGGTAPLSDMLLTETTPGTTVTGDALNNWIRTSSGTVGPPSSLFPYC